MARPSKYSNERTTAILVALRAGNTRKASAAYGGVDSKTFLAWIARHPAFAADVAKAEADAEVRNVAIIQKATTEHWQAAAWWLERRRPEDWKQKSETALTNKDGEALAVRIYIPHNGRDTGDPAPGGPTGDVS